ncbi:hypothetical protein RYA05_05250 [Pseudomonas syringae pv. actinidiae]|nr:hypothetical protein [Pseudomonas syringae pv. actinidiae]
MEAVIDLDDVLINFHGSFLTYLTEKLGLTPNVENHVHFGFYQDYGISDEEFYRLIVSSDFILSLKPFDFSHRALKLLKEHDCSNTICTARGYMKNAQDAVSAILEENRIPYDNLIVVPTGAKKSDCYKSMGKIALLVDDAAHNIADALDYGKISSIYMIDKPWNRSYEPESKKVVRIDSILSAAKRFTQKLNYAPN